MNPADATGHRVVGIGIDLADVARLDEALQRRGGLAARLFTEPERTAMQGEPPDRVAQRFAAKEAVMKALGAGLDSVSFTDIELDAGLSEVRLVGRAARRAKECGVGAWSVLVELIDGPSGEVAVAEVMASSGVEGPQ